jgi:hypothetical protein
MNWSMPRPVLQIVAGALGLACVASFALGIATAPNRARLPGERSGEAGTPLQALEATPLGEDRIEGPAPAPEVSDEEKARLAALKEDREAAALAKAEADRASVQPITPPPAVAPAAAPEATAQAKPQQPEEPPF